MEFIDLGSDVIPSNWSQIVKAFFEYRNLNIHAVSCSVSCVRLSSCVY